MTYEADKLAVNAVYDEGVLGVGRLGSMRLGAAEATLAALDVASVAVSGGFQAGNLGELSTDPVAASGSLSTYGRGAPEVDSAPLTPGTYIEIAYDGTVLFQGVVDSTKTAVEATGDPRGQWVHKLDWTTLSSDAILLATTVSWTSLPAEGALQRLGRWFSVDHSQVAADRVPLLYEPHAAADAGSATLLDLLRAFTERTLLPVRTGVPATTVTILDTAQHWDGNPPTPTDGTEDAAAWTHATDFASRARYSTLTLTGPEFPADYPDEAPPGGGDGTPERAPDVPLAPGDDWTEVPGDDGAGRILHTLTFSGNVNIGSPWQKRTYTDTYPDSFVKMTGSPLSAKRQKTLRYEYGPTYEERIDSVAMLDVEGYVGDIADLMARDAATAAGIPASTPLLVNWTVTAAQLRLWPTPYGQHLGFDGDVTYDRSVPFTVYVGDAPFDRVAGSNEAVPLDLGGGSAIGAWTMADYNAWVDSGGAAFEAAAPIGNVLAVTLYGADMADPPGDAEETYDASTRTAVMQLGADMPVDVTVTWSVGD